MGFLLPVSAPELNMVWGNILGVLGLAGMYLVQEVWHVYLLYGLTGLGIGLGGYVACTTVANNWFVRKRPLAMDIFASAAAAIAGAIYDATGVYTTAFIIVAAFSLAGLICVLLARRPMLPRLPG
jgi:MFS family permease